MGIGDSAVYCHFRGSPFFLVFIMLLWIKLIQASELSDALLRIVSSIKGIITYSQKHAIFFPPFNSYRSWETWVVFFTSQIKGRLIIHKFCLFQIKQEEEIMANTNLLYWFEPMYVPCILWLSILQQQDIQSIILTHNLEKYAGKVLQSETFLYVFPTLSLSLLSYLWEFSGMWSTGMFPKWLYWSKFWGLAGAYGVREQVLEVYNYEPYSWLGFDERYTPK